MIPRGTSRLKFVAIALGVLAWLIPVLAQVWMWLQFSPGAPSLGLLWMVATFGSLLPACALSMLGAWLWRRAARDAGLLIMIIIAIGFAVIAMPACIVALLGVHVVASIVMERLTISPAA